MQPYICITHALGDTAEAERLFDTLVAYGFRCRMLHEASDPTTRAQILNSTVQLIALTSREAHRVETVATDLQRASERGLSALCVSLTEDDNPLDRQFCHTAEASYGRNGMCLERIAYPLGKTPDAQAVGLFIHRLIICRLTQIEGVFSLYRCRRDTYGRVIAQAVAARGGNREAAYALGCAYERGEGVPVLEDDAATWITRAAEAGIPDAMLHLGELCLCGWGVEPDEERAFALFSAVAALGDVRGEYRLGLCYLNGVGVVADPTRAIYHLSRAARWSYAPALYRLGLLYRDGIGTDPDACMALRYLYRACRRGAVGELAHHTDTSDENSIFDETPLSFSIGDGEDDLHATPESTLTLSDMASAADPIHPQDEITALTYPLPPSLYGRRAGCRAVSITVRELRRRIGTAAARRPSPVSSHDSNAQADSGAAFLSASAYTALRRPEQTWIGSLTRSFHVRAPGARTGGHPVLYVERDDVAMGVPFDLSEAALALGGLLESGDAAAHLMPHPTRALVWYRYALRRGNTEALYRLANAYRSGRGTPRDPAWAAVLYRMSADWGDMRGQFALAVCCERGIGMDTDMAEAIRRYEQAAMAGYAPAQNNLGGCYEYGIGVARNVLTAVEWYVRAAETGLPEAMCRLGLCYECGRGVSADSARALTLYEKAAAAGHPYALYRLGVLYDRNEALPSTDREPDTAHPTCAARYAKAAAYWETAAEADVPEAAFALAMCYATGHGVRRDREATMHYLGRSARGGYLPAIDRLAMCYLEGNGTVRHVAHAVDCLREAVQLWRSRKALYLMDTSPLPLCGYAPTEAAGNALYMLGYCILEGLDSEAHADRVADAVALFSEAVELGHAGAAIAVGDLYAYGRLPAADGLSARTTARPHYERAVCISAVRRGASSPIAMDKKQSAAWAALPLPIRPAADPRADSLLSCRADVLCIHSGPALMSLAFDALKRARNAAEHGEPAPIADSSGDGSTDALNEAWQYFAAAVEQGSVDARIGMAECIYYGYGQKPNHRAAFRLLQTADHAENRIIVSLLMGDSLRVGWCGQCLPLEADATYRRALSAVPIDSEVGPYVVAERRAKRLAQETLARAELYYRIAAFRSLELPSQTDGTPRPDAGMERQDTFAYLAEAVLMGHTAAREDLARMYAYERRYNASTAPADTPAPKPRARRRARHTTAHPALRDHKLWLTDYYTALWPEPRPFRYALQSMAVPAHIPPHITEPVTPVMMAAALNYLGDCLFYGSGLDRRPAAAVACYREVARMKLSVPRGEPAPAALVWAQYSLGWCLLHGEGTPQDEREAVKWLTAASRTHPEASFTLGECHERGIGVDHADPREAIKFYRRALKLGYGKAAAKVHEIEEMLRRRAEE